MSFNGNNLVGNYEQVRGNTDQVMGLRQTFETGEFSVRKLTIRLCKVMGKFSDINSINTSS